MSFLVIAQTGDSLAARPGCGGAAKKTLNFVQFRRVEAWKVVARGKPTVKLRAK
jgi:hypothetical protein